MHELTNEMWSMSLPYTLAFTTTDSSTDTFQPFYVTRIKEEKEVSDNIAYLKNASVQNILLFQTDGRMCFGLRVGPMQFDKVSEFV